MSFIKKLQEMKQENNTLAGYLKDHLEGYQKARSIHKIHASDLTKDDPEFCPREIALLRINQKARKDQFIGQATKVAFEIGEAYHDLVRDKWLREIAVGNWICPHCKYKVEFSKLPKTVCPQCEYTDWQYDEVGFYSGELGISGHIDYIADLNMQKHIIVEIKSMDKDQYADLVAPLAEHRIRTSLYLKIIESSDSPYKDHIDLTHARILYVSKGYGKKDDDGKFTPFKEYIIKRNDDAIQSYLDKAVAMVAFTEKGLIPCGVCKNAFDKRMKSCGAATHCFGQSYPAGATWTKD